MTTFTLPPVPPAPAERPNPDLVSSWSMASMRHYADLRQRHSTAEAAAQADRIVAAGADHPSRFGNRHVDAMLALAAAEEHAPSDERAAHMARTDAYATHHGLRGWHRYTSEHGGHRVFVGRLRTPEEGERGRYFYYTPSRVGPDWWTVIDRDTWRRMAHAPHKHAADEWIARAEGTPIPALPTDWPLPVPQWTDRDIVTVELAGVTR